MEIENNHLPLVGVSSDSVRTESEAIRVGGSLPPLTPHPKNSSLRSNFSTSPQGGGDVVHIARSWIGTPYIHQASVKGVGCDCLGLLRGVWRELFGEEPEVVPPYSPDWSEATGEESLYKALARHLREIDNRDIAPGDIALFRMAPNGAAKHCGIVGEITSPSWGGRKSEALSGGGRLTLIHARQNKRVSEEAFSTAWRRRLACAFRL